MLIEAKSLKKSVGAKTLFTDLNFTIVPGEKVALIGRNGEGKTTLLKILSGEDKDFEGSVITRRNLQMTLTKQEHHQDVAHSPVEYILESAHKYYAYKAILENYEQGVSTDIEQYLHALDYFTEKKYFYLPESVVSTLLDFGLTESAIQGPLTHLSGGEKRYVEMVRMMYSNSDLLLIDEPTNHMDYQGKERFISWMNGLSQTALIVTHDRDVLKQVDKILELKDKTIHVFKGNYDHYIAQNSVQTLSSVKQYADQLNRLKEAKKRVEWGLRMRAKSKEWKTRYDHWLRDYEKLKAETVKPSFWIDQNSVEELDKKVVDSYQKFKERNILIKATTQAQRGGDLVAVRSLSLGYEDALFADLHFTLKEGNRVFLKGRNGAGKSTFVRTVVAQAHEQTPRARIFAGEILLDPGVRIGQYEQEISEKYLTLPLEEAIKLSYREQQFHIEDREVKKLLAQYLFDPTLDGKQKILHLSGGQKARFQLIKMFIGEPNLLILDEPTNHLDLPSIEELENALSQFQGGILYISHDTYFIQRMGGQTVEL